MCADGAETPGTEDAAPGPGYDESTVDFDPDTISDWVPEDDEPWSPEDEDELMSGMADSF